MNTGRGATSLFKTSLIHVKSTKRTYGIHFVEAIYFNILSVTYSCISWQWVKADSFMDIFSSCFGIVGICSIRRASITNCRCIQQIAWIFKPSRSTFSFIILFYWKKLHKSYVYYHGTWSNCNILCYEILEKYSINKYYLLNFCILQCHRA